LQENFFTNLQRIVRMRVIILLVIFSLVSTLLGISNPSEDIKEIENISPAFGTLKLELEEKIIIEESDKEGNYIFGTVSDIAIDSSESIYLLDFQLRKISKFDKEGRFVKTIGKVGQGPGEFSFPLKLFIDEKNNLYVNDQGRAIIIYDKDGNFKSILKLNKPISDFYVDEKNCIYTFTREFSESGILKVFVKIDKEGNELKRIADFLEVDVKVVRKGGGGVMGGIKHPYSFDAFFCPLKGEYLCYGENSKYRLFIYDLEGNLKKIFSKKEKKEPISSEERENLSKVSGTFIPPYRPFFKGILSDEKGRIWVIKTKPLLEKEKKERIDLFSKEGIFLYEIELPYPPRVIRNGNIWVIDRDEEERTIIKKLKIKNYNFLKY